MKIDIPYYQQTAEFTCGPACAVMVLKYFDPSLEPTRELEFDLWRESNMIGSWGSDPFGLSIPLLKRGLKVHIITERKQTFSEERLVKHFGKDEAKLALFSIEHSFKKALALGLKVDFKTPSVEDISRSLEKHRIPILLVDMYVVHRYSIPHWVVVTGLGKDGMYINDPYPPRGRKDLKLSLKEFHKMVEGLASKIGASRTIILAYR